MLKENILKDLNNLTYSFDEFYKILKEYEVNDFDVFIGTDSQVHINNIYIATCIAFVRRDSNKGENTSGKIFYVKETLNRKDYPNLRMRMMLEAYRSLEVAMDIEPFFKNNINIHLDIGNNPKYSKTSAFKIELTGMITSQGFNCEIKPNAWCASGVADKVCR